MARPFPKNFLWGSATASYQVEGGIENNDWAQAGREGKVPSAGKACDHYRLYEQDFDIAKSLGQNASRISVEWSRIEPTEGEFNEDAIEHYRDVLKAMHVRGLRPFVTLWHFTLPLWFSARGGFEAEGGPKIFARYCEYVVQKLCDLCSDYLTINEPLVWASNGYERGVWPPFVKSFFRFLRVQKKLVQSHICAYRAIKKSVPSVQVGLAKNNIYFHPRLSILTQKMKWFWNRRFLNACQRANTLDFIGLNYYFHKDFSLWPFFSIKHRQTDMGWDIFPKGLYHVLRELKKYHRPVYITENGIADAKDTARAGFIREHLSACLRAIDGGVDLRGYFYWSLLDNFEWAEGFSPRFGLVEIDYSTMIRTIRPSAHIYAEICQKNSL